MADESTEEGAVVIGWSAIWVTLLVSILQGVIFYCFFAFQRKKEIAKNSYDLYEPRQHTRKHRSPAPFASSWWREALAVTQEETLRCVGLDSYMFLRFLRLGARVCTLGTFLSMLLIPVYATGEARGDATLEFNQLTLARVDQGSDRIWATLVAWYIFIAFILYEFWNEWKLYFKNRSLFLARGDIDLPKDFRYAIRVEQIPEKYRSDKSLEEYFDRLFPNQVREATICLKTGNLEKLVAERHAAILKLEAAEAFTIAKPQKPQPTVKVGATMGLCGGNKVDAMTHYQEEIDRLNKEIDQKRADMSDNEASTAFVIFKSLRAKQAAVQCELTGNPDSIVVQAAPDPKGILWQNTATPLLKQKTLELQMACVWLVGILFWAIPVSFITSIANLNSMLSTFGLAEADPNAFWYGLVAGLLPVIALIVLMMVLYMVITAVATSVVGYKSLPEVDVYCLYWHQLFQFANLWLILIGGSLFNQLDALIEDITSVVDIIATALPGASVFFVNMIIVGSFGAFGMELSMLPVYGLKLVMRIIQPEAMRTQRQLDDDKKPPSLQWGQRIPPIVFVFLVAVLYMPIVPLIEVFAAAYFAGMYLVWKHQTLHVYTQDFEGGGDATWLQLFGFLMACLYMGEVVFIAYCGIKEAPTQGALGFVPLVLTILFHRILSRNIIFPLRNLSLEVAANVDIEESTNVDMEAVDERDTGVTSPMYRQPALRDNQDKRGPLPYRRDEIYQKVKSVGVSQTEDGLETVNGPPSLNEESEC